MSAAVIMNQQNRALRRFRAAAAIDLSHAVRLEDVHVRENWVFRRMVARGVFVATTGGTYYLDEAAAQRFLQRRTKIAICVCVAGALLALLIAVW